MEKNLHGASRAFKQKLKKDKEKAHLELLKKIQKLDQLFCVKNKVIEADLGEGKGESSDHSRLRLLSESKLTTDDNSEVNLKDSDTWRPLNDEAVDYAIRNMPKHVTDIKDCDFSVSKRVYNDHPNMQTNIYFLPSKEMQN
ncbi:hypothetical protein ILUMI_27128 [Ignelater luminosus]|uniref:Uncharacterized protein n=1 Tax=Ignelater luminosus TaxID=2038154 RepID=A0A8K0C4W5_IGNLU|nr:hypothetical protein ILUMI_27128 [Ignelater luminosus]